MISFEDPRPRNAQGMFVANETGGADPNSMAAAYGGAAERKQSSIQRIMTALKTKQPVVTPQDPMFAALEPGMIEMNCWPGYRKNGTKKSGRTGKMVNNCVKEHGVEGGVPMDASSSVLSAMTAGMLELEASEKKTRILPAALTSATIGTGIGAVAGYAKGKSKAITTLRKMAKEDFFGGESVGYGLRSAYDNDAVRKAMQTGRFSSFQPGMINFARGDMFSKAMNGWAIGQMPETRKAIFASLKNTKPILTRDVEGFADQHGIHIGTAHRNMPQMRKALADRYMKDKKSGLYNKNNMNVNDVKVHRAIHD